MEATRRRFLGGLAVASALSGVAAAPAFASAPGENPDLMKLGADFDAANERFIAAGDRLLPLQEAYRAIAPAIPGDLIAVRGGYAWNRNFADFMCDPVDPDFKRMKDTKGNLLEVIQSYRIEASYGARFDARNTAAADFTEATDIDIYLHATAKQFEAAVEEAMQVAGLPAAIAEYQSAQSVLRRIIYDLCGIRAKTLTGVALKVRATAAYAAFGADERFTASGLLARAVWEDMGEDA